MCLHFIFVKWGFQFISCCGCLSTQDNNSWVLPHIFWACAFFWTLLNWSCSSWKDVIKALYLCLPSSAAKVGKTSLIMSLVSEEFPDVVRIRFCCVICLLCVFVPAPGFYPFLLKHRSFAWVIVVSLITHCKHVWVSVCSSGSLPSWGDHHTCRCHTRESSHAHCGLFRFFKNAVSWHRAAVCLFLFEHAYLPSTEAEQTDEQLFQEISKVSQRVIFALLSKKVFMFRWNPYGLLCWSHPHRQMWFALCTLSTTRSP